MNATIDKLTEIGFEDLTRIMTECVYVLVHNGKVVYVGKSREVMRRIRQHRSAFEFDQVFVKPCVDPYDERWIIKTFRPKGNVAWKT